MKKIIIIASLFLISVLLVGCMSMLGLGSDKEETDTNEIETEETDTNEVKADENEEVEVKEEENETDTEPLDSSSETDTNTESTDQQATEDCAENYDVFLEELPDDFPMPECAIIGNVLVDNNRVDSTYETEDDWSDLYSFYKDYLGENIEQQNQVLDEEKGDLSGNINGGKLDIEIKEIEDNHTKVRVFYRFP